MNIDLFLNQMSKKNITKSELANRLGITRQSVSTMLNNWSRGTEPKLSTLKKWCRALGVSEKDIFKSL